MPAFPRAELEEMVERWLAANRAAEAAGDWRPMADLYTEDATYGWNLGPGEEFMAVGRDEIRDVAFGLEMAGLENWTYPYEEVLIDERKGQVIGLWRQVADAKGPDGSPYEVAGLGGSWFRYAGNGQWSWQRDWFDFGNVATLFVQLLQDGLLSDAMAVRMTQPSLAQPGHYPLGAAPVGLWEVP